MTDFQKMIALISILASGLYALIGWNLTISYDALKVANKAIRAAESSRPNPWTSINQNEYAKVHQEQHVREIEVAKETLGVQIKLINAEHLRAIDLLPRPPDRWVDKWDLISDRVKDLEIEQVRRGMENQ